jgi:hypothetical protein
VNERTLAHVRPEQKASSFAPTRSGSLQRKCACGGTPGPDGECAGCRRKRLQRRSAFQTEPLDKPASAIVGSPTGHDFSQMPVYAPEKVQQKLMVNTPGDVYEQEADRIADRVMRMPHAQLQPARASNGLRTEQPAHSAGISEAAPIVHEVLGSPGRPLDAAAKAFFTPRFGHDFSYVSVHADTRAAESAEAVKAKAYTVGQHVVFGVGQYEPDTPPGRLLIAHELTHVLQQSTSGKSGVLQRAPDEEVRGAPNAKTWTGAPSECGPDFCRPLESPMMAPTERQAYWPYMKKLIGLRVNSRVVPLWDAWAWGGTRSVLNLTKEFGADFAMSATTAETTQFLLDSVKAKLRASPPTVPPATGFLKLDIPALIPAEVAAIDDPNSPNSMDFDTIGEIPGNIAGGIGKDQAATPIGARPSPQDDARIAKGELTVIDNGSSLMVMPNLSFTVKDTIDFCPGNCGSEAEQQATVLMSRWEATGMSGDVPYTVNFPAYPPSALPFTVPKTP